MSSIKVQVVRNDLVVRENGTAVPFNTPISLGMGDFIITKARKGVTIEKFTGSGRLDFSFTAKPNRTYVFGAKGWYEVRLGTNPVRAALRAAGIPGSALTVGDPNGETARGGDLCRHATSSGSWNEVSTDGTVTVLSEPGVVEDHPNEYHVGCASGPAVVLVEGATWKVERYTTRNTDRVEVVVAPGADLNKVAAEITAALA